MMQMGLMQAEEVLGTDNMTLDITGFGDYSPKTILSGTVGDINPQFEMSIDATLNGARGTALLHQIAEQMATRKMNKDNFRNRHMEQMVAATMASLFSGAKVQMRFNKVDTKGIMQVTPMGEMQG